MSAARAEDAWTTSRDVRGVVELFTSQGCSSCPAADRVLTALTEDPGIVALSYHVDYWDYIGWRDPHGSPHNTDRQRAYAKTFKSGSIYTPQAVVNGQRDVVGSHGDDVATALTETALNASGSDASVDLRIDGGRLHIRADAKGPVMGSRVPVLMLVTFSDKTATLVDRGENKGLTLVASHAVRDWRVLGMWDGKPLDIEIPLASLKEEEANGRTGCAAILQMVTDTGAPGPILAAAAVEF